MIKQLEAQQLEQVVDEVFPWLAYNVGSAS
jgi:hypothetical protein